MAPLSKAQHWQAHCHAHPIPQETLAHFAANPLLCHHLQHADYDPIPTFSRVVKPDGEDAFFARTLSSPDTIPHFLTLLRRGLGAGPVASDDGGGGTRAPDSVGLVTLGGGDLVGHAAVVHGGVSTALLDESMSFLLHMYLVRVAGGTPRNSVFTVNLNVNFRAAVPAPGDVVLECWIRRVVGRKYVVAGVMKDTAGKVLVEAEGLWLSMRAANL